MKDLAGGVAVVTGAAGGIGNALARRFAERGMKVVLADIGEEALGEAEEVLRAGGAEVLGVVTDVSEAESVEALARQAVQHFGRVHVVCNNAGVGGADGSPAWALP
ncbi:MAG: SDR family NAD(P)-dependent oxidoreductase [Acidimicrobiia bacterium]|nr:SDR family NAD(P)-dependent oxidoreductase [Acidimicrobiia bacterium]